MSRNSEILRGIFLALFLLGVLATGGELLLLGHTERYWQFVPLVLLGLSLVAVLVQITKSGPATIRFFQLIMILFLISGLLGVYLHYHGNTEFKLETYPWLKGFELFWAALRGATPTLAPAQMIELGLLGLGYCYRHPVLGKTSRYSSQVGIGES